MTKKYENILFDMDGVLINSMKYHVQAWKIAFLKFNINVTEQKIMSLGGMTSAETIQVICKEHNLNCNSSLIKQIKEEKGKQLDKIFQVELYPDILENLKTLKDRGFKLALVSGCRHFEVEKTSKDFFPDIFDVVISGDDVKHGKPNPEPYLAALDKLNIDKIKTLVIEDAPSGIQSANSANIDVFAITTSFPKKELDKFKPTKIFETHEKLFKYIIP